MRALSAVELLGIWEGAQGRPPTEQALRLLASACPEIAPAELAAMSIGRRDTQLLALREQTFGPQLESLAVCPDCGERLEVAFDAAGLLGGLRAAAVDTDEELQAEAAGYTVRFRLPTSLDLVAAGKASDGSVGEMRRQLLERCILSTTAAEQNIAGAGEEHGISDAAGQRGISGAAGQRGISGAAGQRGASDLPAELLEAVEERMANADPGADVQLSLTCPACGVTFQTGFDIVSYFWQEIETWAYRTLREVHVLASAYGWAESDILAMSAQRRQYYLEMVGR